jgi:hypothetical protein
LLFLGFSFSLSFSFNKAHISKQYYIHQQSIYDSRDSYSAIIEDEWAGSYCYGLCSILHAYLNDDGSTFFGIEARKA